MTAVYISIGVVLFFGLIYIILYNGLVSRRNKVEYAFGSLDAMLKQRYDLIPNLVATVQQYAQHERGVLEQITALRAKAVQTTDSNERAAIEKQLDGQMRQLMVSVESYPDLKANQNFIQLQGSLNECEAQIAAARRAYNAAVLEYNNGAEMFPSSIVAGMMNYPKKEMFAIPEEERQNVSVKNLFNS
jgi:LemA protein